MSVPHSHREIPFRTRPDLAYAVRHETAQIVVKDPIALRYFLVSCEEKFVLDQLASTLRPIDLKQKLETRFFPRRTDYAELQHLIATLVRSGLINSVDGRQGPRLVAAGRKTEQSQWKGNLNPLFIRLPGIDPEPALQRLYPLCAWLFTPATALMALMFSLFTLLVFVGYAGEWGYALPSMESLRRLETIPMLVIAIGFSKVVHELGHALACKHFGGECHEIGIALFFFSPCVFCDTSDSWMLPARISRILVAAAGMLSEFMLASIAAWVWYFASSDLLRQQCFLFIATCTVSTLVVNLNPLLKYDGYFILSDLTGISNLWSRSRTLRDRWLLRLCFGIKMAPTERLAPRQAAGFFLYAVLSEVYRWAVLAGAFWYVWMASSHYGLRGVGAGLLMLTIVLMSVKPAKRVTEFMKSPARRRKIKKFNLLVTLVCLLGTLFSLSMLPLPLRIAAFAVVEPKQEASVYVPLTGIIESTYTSLGARVVAGQPLATLRNTDLDERVHDLEAKCEIAALQFAQARRMQGSDPAAASHLTSAENLSKELHQQLAAVRQSRERLQLTAPIGGIVHSAVSGPGTHQWYRTQTELGQHPLDGANEGGLLSTGDLLCRICDTQQLEIVCVVPQSDIENVTLGAEVSVLLTGASSLPLQASVIGISESPSMKSDDRVASTADERTTPRGFDVRIRLNDTSVGSLIDGMTADVRIHCRATTFLSRTRKWFGELFRFYD